MTTSDLVAAMTKAIDTVYPGTPVFPSLSSGTSDSMWYRYHGVGSYGASPAFMKDTDDFAHGLNERAPIANSRPVWIIMTRTPMSSHQFPGSPA